MLLLGPWALIVRHRPICMSEAQAASFKPQTCTLCAFGMDAPVALDVAAVCCVGRTSSEGGRGGRRDNPVHVTHMMASYGGKAPL